VSDPRPRARTLTRESTEDADAGVAEDSIFRIPHAEGEPAQHDGAATQVYAATGLLPATRALVRCVDPELDDHCHLHDAAAVNLLSLHSKATPEPAGSGLQRPSCLTLIFQPDRSGASD
jgi:hypothetical protein